jgi:5-methylcytosine-specific restriction endonuclease McrA
MTVPAATWEQVRQRAALSCEFCGVTEADTGGRLTVDHFQPTAKRGTDDPDNLIYCCFRCNQYKHD